MFLRKGRGRSTCAWVLDVYRNRDSASCRGGHVSGVPIYHRFRVDQVEADRDKRRGGHEGRSVPPPPSPSKHIFLNEGSRIETFVGGRLYVYVLLGSMVCSPGSRSKLLHDTTTISRPLGRCTFTSERRPLSRGRIRKTQMGGRVGLHLSVAMSPIVYSVRVPSNPRSKLPQTLGSEDVKPALPTGGIDGISVCYYPTPDIRKWCTYLIVRDRR